MMNYFQRRRARKQLRLLLKQARHVRNLREDVASEDALGRLDRERSKACEALAGGSAAEMTAASKVLEQGISSLLPRRNFSWLRDNIEMVAVALAVAMAFRTYFLQPFKIPTSSMSPTLHGITYEPKAEPGFSDRFPVGLIQWIVFGRWFVDIRSETVGAARFRQGPGGERVIDVAGAPHFIPENMHVHVSPGQRVFTGQRLASGVRTAGDHILVNKMAWYFTRPTRGRIAVFRTDDIEHPQIKKNEHYVKRLVAMPGENLRVAEPYLEIDGIRLSGPDSIRRIQERRPGYVGFLATGTPLEGYGGEARLGADEFYALGDNQSSSLDSRYWGPVPGRNLVGPAFLIYWPVSSRWGLVE